MIRTSAKHVEGVEAHDLGTLRPTRISDAETVLVAPGRLTRAVWLVGAFGSLVFLWSAAVTLGWADTVAGGVTLLRWPMLGEAFFWMLPLLLFLFCLAMSLGGVRLTLSEGGLELRSLWPDPTRHHYSWASLRYARFWTEATRSREKLFVARFRFEHSDITFRLGNEPLWKGLQERYGDDVQG